MAGLMTVRPFFTYYGGKWRSAKGYPAPLYDTIIEPFAGSAGYSLRYHRRRVVLVDLNPVVAGVWRFLISSSSSDILALPLLEKGAQVSDLAVCQEARWLIGFCCNKGTSQPRLSLSAWGRDPAMGDQFWGERVRAKVAAQVPLIKHWEILEGDYSAAPNQDATWFIDPPYSSGGEHYPKKIKDYSRLASWCRSRRGQAIVCESLGADWLPFRRHARIKALGAGKRKKTSDEMIWTAGAGQVPLFL